MIILPTKEQIEVYDKLQPYTYLDKDFLLCLIEDAPEEAKELWNKHLKFKTETEEIYRKEMFM